MIKLMEKDPLERLVSSASASAPPTYLTCKSKKLTSYQRAYRPREYPLWRIAVRLSFLPFWQEIRVSSIDWDQFISDLLVGPASWEMMRQSRRRPRYRVSGSRVCRLCTFKRLHRTAVDLTR